MENKSLNLQFPLYFPECKIISINLVPQAHGKYFVWSLHLKSLIKTPAHYPQHPLLDGKADFYFGIEASDSWINQFNHSYETVFSSPIKSPKLMKGKKVSVLAHFVHLDRLTLSTLGIGIPNGDITLYNLHLKDDEMVSLSIGSKLQYKVPVKEIKKRKKI